MFIPLFGIHFCLVPPLAYTNFLRFIGSTGIYIALVCTIFVSTKSFISNVILDAPSTLQPKIVPNLPMRWSPLACAAPWPNRLRSQCPSIPQQQNLHLQMYCATKVSTTVFSVFCSCFWDQKDFPADHVYCLLHSCGTTLSSAIPFYSSEYSIIIKIYWMSS